MKRAEACLSRRKAVIASSPYKQATCSAEMAPCFQATVATVVDAAALTPPATAVVAAATFASAALPAVVQCLLVPEHRLNWVRYCKERIPWVKRQMS